MMSISIQVQILYIWFHFLLGFIPGVFFEG